MVKRQAVSLFGWILAGALLGALAAAGYFTFAIIRQGGSLAGAPVSGVLFEVMRLHVYAGYGALGGLCVGLARAVHFLFTPARVAEKTANRCTIRWKTPIPR